MYKHIHIYIYVLLSQVSTIISFFQVFYGQINVNHYKPIYTV